MANLIERQAAIDALETVKTVKAENGELYIAKINAQMKLEILPSAQPDIIRCKDCEYLCDEDGLRGMCWHINGFGDVKDKYNSFCSWAKRRE